MFSKGNYKGISYVNIGVIGKNTGTVSDEHGNYSIILNNITDNDSIRFSRVGYESEVFLIKSLRDNSNKTIYLNPKTYELAEASVSYHKSKRIRIGIPVTNNSLNSGFAYNSLGSEMGINVDIRKTVKLSDVNLNVAVNTFDSVTYRLNIYQSETRDEWKNILQEPIFIRFSKAETKNVLTFDLSRYSIILKGNTLVTLEIYKDYGEGQLLFHTDPKISSTYFRKTSEGTWYSSPGVIGLYLNAIELK